MVRNERARPALSAVVIQDAPWFGPGHLPSVLTQTGFTVQHRVQEIGPEDLSADLVVVLGGALTPREVERSAFLTQVRALIDQRLASSRPVLGVCLGAQLLALAGGGRIIRQSAGPAWGLEPVVPTTEGREDPLFGAGVDRLDVVHWHEDAFEIPRGAMRVASSRVSANEAFRLGSGLGCLFHLQTDAAEFEQWLGAAYAQPVQGGRSVEEIRRYDLWRLRMVQHRNVSALERVITGLVNDSRFDLPPDGPVPA